MVRAIFVAVAFGIGGVALTLWWLDEDLSTVVHVPAWAFAVGAALVVVNYLAGTARLMLLARLSRTSIRFGQALRAYGLGLFSAAVTPGSAGQAPAVALALVRDGLKPSQAWSMNLFVWVVDLTFLAWTLPISVLLLGRSTRLLEGVDPLLLAFGLFAFIAVLGYVLLFHLRWLAPLVGAILRLPVLRRWRTSVVDFVYRVDDANASLRRAGVGTQLVLHVLTACVYLSTYLVFYVVVASLRPGTPLLVTMAVAQVPMVLSSFLPTPGGSGLLEILTASLLLAGSDGSPRAAVGTQGGLGDAAPGALFAPGAGGGAAAASGTVAAAVLGWRLLTYYSRLVIGPVLGGAALRRNGRTTTGEGVTRTQEASPPPRHDASLDQL